jgi:hypothetical protein
MAEQNMFNLNQKSLFSRQKLSKTNHYHGIPISPFELKVTFIKVFQSSFILQDLFNSNAFIRIFF